MLKHGVNGMAADGYSDVKHAVVTQEHGLRRTMLDALR